MSLVELNSDANGACPASGIVGGILAGTRSANPALTLPAVGSFDPAKPVPSGQDGVAEQKDVSSGKRGTPPLSACEGPPARPLHAARPSRVSLPGHQHVAGRARLARAGHRRSRRPCFRLSRPYRPGRGLVFLFFRLWLCVVGGC